jgi:acetyl/propionyl-CoA carboxylase alpha subunit
VRQEDVVFRGHAIEARISAEDPYNKFLPAAGVVEALHDPAGPGVRMDSGLYQGMRIPLFYDPLLAKLICWGEDRAEAIARLRRALDEYVIAGVRTTIPFAQWLMRQPRFIAGDFSTDYIAEEWRPQALATVDGPDGDGLTAEQVAALAAALIARDGAAAYEARKRAAATGEGHEEGWRWRQAGRKTATSGW